jgi:hypothetical protein
MLEAFYATERGSLEDATINGGFDLHQIGLDRSNCTLSRRATMGLMPMTEIYLPSSHLKTFHHLPDFTAMMMAFCISVPIF